MNVAILSMFQNAAHYIDRYVRQVRDLIRDAPEHTFEMVLGEGDSTDNEWTWNRLNDEFPGGVYKCVHGGRLYYPASPDHPQRWSQLSAAWNQLLPHVKPEHDAALHVEADLFWDSRTIVRMLDRLNEVEAVTCLCDWSYHKERHPCCRCNYPDIQHLYDWFGPRSLNDVKFNVCPPYSSIFSVPSPNGLYEVGSAGSIMVLRGEIPRACRYDPADLGMTGYCHNIRRHGYKIWMWPKVYVSHP